MQINLSDVEMQLVLVALREYGNALEVARDRQGMDSGGVAIRFVAEQVAELEDGFARAVLDIGQGPARNTFRDGGYAGGNDDGDAVGVYEARTRQERAVARERLRRAVAAF